MFKSTLIGPGVGSALHEHLKQHFRMVEHDGGQNVADHDLLILDSDTHTPQDLVAHPLLRGALDTGTWILLLDATYEHKKEGLFSHLKMATEGDIPKRIFSGGSRAEPCPPSTGLPQSPLSAFWIGFTVKGQPCFTPSHTANSVNNLQLASRIAPQTQHSK